MLIDVPYYYEAEIRRPRKRNTETVTYVASVTVEVREATDAEAPVALRVEDPHGPIMDRGIAEYRWFDDRLWAAYQPSDASREPRIHRDADWLRSVNDKPQRYNNPLSAGARAPYHYKATPISDDLLIAEVRENKADEAVAGIRDRAEAMLVVDGMLWRAASEPRLVLNEASFGTTKWVSVRADDHNEQAHSTFRLDEGAIIAKARPDAYAEDEEVELPHVEILIPEAVRLRATEHALAESAESLIDEMKGRLADNEVDYFVAFATLRKELARFRPFMDAREAPACDTLVEAVRNGLAAEEARPRRYSHEQLASWQRERIEGALIRHDLRGQDLDALASFGP